VQRSQQRAQKSLIFAVLPLALKFT